MLTIVIPFRYFSPWLFDAVASVPPPGPEVSALILVCDGADSETLACVASAAASVGWSSHCRVVSLGGVGPSAARNAALDSVTTPYVLFLDSDDLLHTDAVVPTVRALASSNLDALVCGWTDIVEDPDSPQRQAFPVNHNEPIASLLLRWWPVSSVMQRVTGTRFDEHLKIWEVLDYQVRMIGDHSLKVGYREQSLCAIRHHSSPKRVSNSEDHFHPLSSARIFAGIKNYLSQRELLSRDVLSAADENLMMFAQGALARGSVGDAIAVASSIDRAHLPRSRWFRILSFGGSLWLFGAFLGTRLYVGYQWFSRLRIRSSRSKEPKGSS